MSLRALNAAGRLVDECYRRINASRGTLQVGRGSSVRWRCIRGVGSGTTIQIGDECMVEAAIRFDRTTGSLRIGDRTFIGRSDIVIADSVDIGSDVLISWGVTIVDHNSHSTRFQDRAADVVNWMQGVKDWKHVEHASIQIRDRAWIGFNAIILKGVSIGFNSIVGAGAVVTRDVPDHTIVGGNPAQIIRELRLNERE